MASFLNQFSCDASSQVVQYQNKTEPKEHLGLYGECFDSLPTVNTSSRFMFNVNSFALHDIVEDLVDGEVLTSPVGNSSFLSKPWLAIQLRLDNVDRDQRYALRSVSKRERSKHPELAKYSEHDLFVMNSLAPYGYEYEASFFQAQEKELNLPYKAHNKLANYSPKYVSGKTTVHRLVETDSTIYFTEFLLRCTYNSHENLLLTTLAKKSTRKFIFWKATKQLVQLQGNKLSLNFTNVPLPDEMRELLYDYLYKHDSLKFKLLNNNRPRGFSTWRKVLLNRFWTDINSNYALNHLTSSDNLYSRVMYHYKKYGTKQARQALYSTKNKGLIKAYESFSNAHQTHEAIETTKYLVKERGFTEDQALSYLNHTVQLFTTAKVYSGSPMYMYNIHFFKNLQSVQETYPEITFAKLKNLPPQHVGVEIRDIYNSLQMIKSAASVVQPPIVVSYPAYTSDLGALSTRLSNLLQSFRNIEDQIPFPASKEQAEMFDAEDDDFIYRYADSVFKLKECGNALSICVGSYGRRAKCHETNIVFVHKKSEPEKHYACIEVTSGEVRQVKLSRNTRGSTDEVLNKSVLVWADSLDLSATNCYDLDVSERLSALREDLRGYNQYNVDIVDLF